MSFSDKIKDELSKNIRGKDCCLRSLYRGMLMFSEKSDNNIKFKSGSENAVLLFADLSYLLISVEGSFKRGKIFSYEFTDFSSIDVINRFLKSEKIFCDKCPGYYARGAFLAAGSISDPEKAFRIDISYKDNDSSSLFLECCKLPGIGFNLNKKYRRLFIKGNNNTSDFLSFIGANDAFYDFVNRGIIKKMRGDAERVNNFELANIKKTSSSFSSLLSKLEKIPDGKLQNLLGDELYETAVLKRNNPELSLSELGLMHTSGISKSGVYHRLIKIKEKLSVK